jgi:anti-sigma28 factor (negative regulator of flagellin synthesis)
MCDGVDTEVRLLGQTPIVEGRAHQMRMNELQQRVGRGEYEVDSHAVADAILRRIMAGQLRPSAPRAADSTD